MTGEEERSSPTTPQQRIPKKKKFTHDVMADDGNAKSSSSTGESAVPNSENSIVTTVVDDDGKRNSSELRPTIMDGSNETGVVEHLERNDATRTDRPSEIMTLFDPPLLRKGDLVRLSNEQRSGRIQGGLARITRVIFAITDDDIIINNNNKRAGDVVLPTGYDIEYVLGGKLSNLARSELAYTTATAEGLVDATDQTSGHLLRRRRPAAEKEREGTIPADKKDKEKQRNSAGGNDVEPVDKRKPGRPPNVAPVIKRKPGRPPKAQPATGQEEERVHESSASLSKKDKGRKNVLTSSAIGKKPRNSKNIDNDSNVDDSNRSKIAKLGWETRRAKEAAATTKATSKDTSGLNGKRSNKRYSNADTSESDATSTAGHMEELSGWRRVDCYTKQRKEMEKSLQRLEKVDRFGFFLDATPPEFDENYDHDDGDDIPGTDDGYFLPAARKNVQFPDQPPFNFLVVRKRIAAGRYIVDMVASELNRLKEIKAMVHTSRTNEEKHNFDVDYDELKQSMCNPIAVDWNTFNADINGMCDAALVRDPEGPSLGSGHLGWAAIKVKKMMEQMYLGYGYKRRLEVEENEARERYKKILLNCGNAEAAMQGKWRKEAFPERKYERLQTSSVICDGLSPKDRSYAMYELETKLPDSFVGLAYTYDDSGQLSEMWMKTVADETNQNKHKKTRQKKKTKDVKDDSDSVVSKNESAAQKAAMALAKDDGVVRAQVQTTMVNLLIQVQDRVMTDLGVMHSPEARSANWDDGDRGRDYRGGSAEVEQGTHSVLSLPEVAEQEVWGIDCYTRKNVMTLLESEFSPEIAVEFIEKWLLPAINACPIDLAHKMSTAARILEGQEPIAISHTKTNLLDDATSVSSDADGSFDDPCQPCETQVGSRNVRESCVFLRDALKSKIKDHSPPWLKSAARLIRLVSDSMNDDFFRIHPKGHGSVVIAEGGLKANYLVTYYRGEVYPAWRWCEKLDAIEQVQKKLNLRPNLPDFYNMAMERPKKDPRGYCLLFVDASRKSGLGSSFSHSCNPTCEVRVVSLNGKLSLSMTTLRDLEQGEELTFDYNAVTESLNEYRFAVCLCGHQKCRGSFLHYATADCYQQVLSRNSPISARFANLVRGCMKQVMSKEDSELLLKHGFNTAAFGAVSFNHHFRGVDPQSNPDSIENVPVWLRTYVAECLRYIEYERRALPVALLCNQMERQEKKQPKLKASLPKKEEPAPAIESSSKQKSVPGSKPATSYFYFLQSQREHWESIARLNYGELKGLEFSQEVNKAASRAWSNLTDEEKMSWKKKSIADWKKKGGKEKAKEEAERLSGLKNKTDESAKLSTLPKAADKQKVINVEGHEGKDKPVVHDALVEAKSISIADADAEGFSAMEQRIQQLAQSLSRIGRVLDRHRESVCAERKALVSSIDSDQLRDLVHSPLKIMSDEEVVNWIWSDCKGVVPALFSMIDGHFPEQSILRKLLSNTKDSYPVLSAFGQNRAVYFLDRKGKNSCTSAHARKLVREALLSFRLNIMDFLALAEKSNSYVRNEKRRDQARAREQKRQGNNFSSGPDLSHDSTDTSSDIQNVHAISLQATANEDVTQQRNLPTALDIHDSLPPGNMESNTENNIVTIKTTVYDPDRHNLPPIAPSSADEEVVLMRGGGEECASTFCQLSTGFEPLTNPMDDMNIMLSDAPIKVDDSTMDASIFAVEDVHASSQFITIESRSGDTKQRIDGESRMCVDTVDESQMRGAKSESAIDVIDAQSLLTLRQLPSEASRLQVLIDAASNNRVDGVGNTEVFSSRTSSLLLTEEITSEPANMEAESKKSRKKNSPLSLDQVGYLKNWLFNPNHILTPYPTEEEKSMMMKDIGIDRCRLDSWFMKNRPRVLNPEVKQINMKWRKGDQDHWETFRKSRYMLEATADLLLMYANTDTFFLLEPFRHFDSTPIDVYARELGNEVPCRFALNGKSGPGSTPDDVATSCGKESTEQDAGGFQVDERARNSKTSEAEAFCPPDEVIDKVTVDYTGEYVVSQLLQWFNGGIGQKRGLPDLYGCAMLPPIAGCWEEIMCNEVKLPNHTRWNHSTVTEYDSVSRPKLAEWIADRYQRGSPWDRDVAKYFCPVNQVAADPTLPIGSPVLDYLVTGNDENMQQVSSALRRNTGDTEQGRSKSSATDRLQSTVDDGMPAQAVANWVQCENPECLKWRKLPWHVDVDLLPEKFFCKDNIWNPKSQHCNAIEDEWDMGDAPIKFDTNDENFEVGAWFDVQREGKVGYHEAQVVELDLASNVKRIKFHFWKLPSDRDEWIVVGSPRIAPHHSYTPRPLDGYSSRSKRNPVKSKEWINELPSVVATVLSQKRKMDDPDKDEPRSEGASDEPAGFALFAKPIIEYLNEWMIQHADHPYPTPSEKAVLIADTGLTKRQISDWMARSRKKLKTIPITNKSTNSKEPELALTNDLAILDSAHSNPANGKNLLLDLRNQIRMPGDIRTGKVDVEEDIFVSPSTNPTSSNKPTSIKDLEIFLKTWLTSSEGNLFPTLAQKESIILATGIDKKRLEGWFFRARKKIKKQESMSAVVVESSASEDKERLNDQNIPAGSLTTRFEDSIGRQATQNLAVSPSRKDDESEKVQTPFNARSQSSSSSAEPPLTKVVPTKNSDESKGLTSEAKAYLSRWLSDHFDNPYPNREEKDAMMLILGISHEKQLEGWFCRARKLQKKYETFDDHTLDSKNKSHQSSEPLLSSSYGESGAIKSTNQESDFGSLALSSNFATLLSAAKSELSEGLWENSPELHAGTQVTRNEPTFHQSDDSQQTRLPTPFDAASLESFQGSDSAEIQDRASASPSRMSQSDHPDEQIHYSSYHRVQRRASPSEYTQYHYPRSHANAEFVSYPESYSVGNSSCPHGESYNSSQGQMRASPTEYMHESALVQSEVAVDHRTNIPYYQHIGGRHQVQHFSYPHPQHSDVSRYHEAEGNEFHQPQSSNEQQHQSLN